MKLFSTISCEAPVILKRIESKVMMKMDFLSFNTIFTLRFAKEELERFCLRGGVFLRSINTVGKIMNEIKNESVIPADIIHPRLMIGSI